MKKIKTIIVTLILLFLVVITLIGIIGKNNVDISNIKPGDIIVACSMSPVQGYWEHSAMYIGNGEILDASFYGIIVSPIEVFYKKNQAMILRVKTTDEIREKAVEFAKSKVGYPFKLNWMLKQQDGDSYYCSELIWAAYYNASNGTINLDSRDPKMIQYSNHETINYHSPIMPDDFVQSKHVEEISKDGMHCFFPPSFEVLFYPIYYLKMNYY